MTAIAIILSSITIALTIVRSKGRKKTPRCKPNHSESPNRWIR